MQKNNMQSKRMRMEMGRRTKIIKEHRQTGGDADGDGDDIVRIMLVGLATI